MKVAGREFIGTIESVEIGNVTGKGGSRDYQLTTPSYTNMPFYPGSLPTEPLLPFEISFTKPQNYPSLLEKEWSDVWDSPISWSKKCIEQHGAQMLCITLAEAKNEELNITIEKIADIVSETIREIKVPFIIKGTGIAGTDNLIIPEICRNLKGEKLIVGPVIQENYREIMESALENSHLLIAESPIDINIAKQLNIMLTDNGFPRERIIMDPTSGGLGYGLEYTYSIMERAMLAALTGDKSLAFPMINFAGQEAWKSKEAAQAGYLWEAVTAIAFIQAGSSITVIRHPQTYKKLKKYIKNQEGLACFQ